MSTVAAEIDGLEGPLSPELVLVSPPELAALARRLLPQSPFVVPVASRAEPSPPLALRAPGDVAGQASSQRAVDDVSLPLAELRVADRQIAGEFNYDARETDRGGAAGSRA